MSEHDWQATVLAELGIQEYGLVTPDSGVRSPNISSASSGAAQEGWDAPSVQPSPPDNGAKPAEGPWTASGEPSRPQETGDGRPDEYESTRYDGRAQSPSSPQGQEPSGQAPRSPWEDPSQQTGQGPAQPARQDPPSPVETSHDPAWIEAVARQAAEGSQSPVETSHDPEWIAAAARQAAEGSQSPVETSHDPEWIAAAARQAAESPRPSAESSQDPVRGEPQPPAEPPGDPAPPLRPPTWEQPAADPYVDRSAQQGGRPQHADQAPRRPDGQQPQGEPGWQQPSDGAGAGWGPPALDSPYSDRGAAESPYRDPEQESFYREQAAPVPPDAGPPKPAEEPPGEPPSGWEQASEASWDQVAQPSWGPPADGVAPAAHAQSGAEAWQQEPPQPQVRHAAPPGPPGPPSQAAGGPMVPHDLVRKSAHGDPFVRRMSRGVRRAVGSSAADEVRRAADVESILSRAVPSLRQIAVTSIRGGAGKTTVAGLTATVIAQYRQDRVLAIDADSGLGSLPLRLGVGGDRSLHDLSASRPRTFEEASRFLTRTSGGLWVLSGTAGGRITHELDLATFQSAVTDMSRYFSAVVVDCGAGLLPELQRGILADAHSQVMVTPGTVDGALSARGALDWQARNGYEHLLARTVIAFVTHTPHVDADLTRAAQMLSGGGLPVVHLPYDRHLATGTAIESARIGQETRAAAIRVAIEAFERATSV